VAQEAQDADGPSPEEEARALELFERAVALYREGEFTESATLLREAYSLHEEPVLLYNLARALEGDGDYPAAIDAYQRYLDTAGEIPDRGAIERKLETLRANVAERARLGRFDETVGETPEGREGEATTDGGGGGGESGGGGGGGVSPIPWIVAGVGAVGLGVSGILGGMALGAHDAALTAPSQAETDAEQRRAQDLAVATNITLIASAVVLAAGVTWGVIDLSSSSSREDRDVAARVRVGLGTIALEGSFR
jgi:tetratricopeptide (TPR) repeat protein